jgi:hypothetical protein
MDPTLSGVFLYAENIALASGLLFVSVLFALSKSDGMGALAHWEPETEPGRFYTLRKLLRWWRVNQVRIGGFLVFFFGAVSYVVGGIYAAVGISMIQQPGLVWPLHVIRIPQVVGVWAFIRGITRRRQRNSPPDDQIKLHGNP